MKMRIPTPILLSLTLFSFQMRAATTEPFPSGLLVKGPAFLEYAVYLTDPDVELTQKEAEDLLRSKYSKFSILAEPEADKLCAHVSLIDDVKESYAVPDMRSLRYFGRGVSKENAANLQECEKAIIAYFSLPEEKIDQGILDASHYIADLARMTNGIIWDESTRLCFGVKTWSEDRLKEPNNGFVDIRDHITIHAYKDTEYIRAITLGMEKFGLPDIEVSDFSWSDNRSVGNLINLFAQLIYESKSIEKTGEYVLEPHELKNSQVRSSTVESLFDNAKEKVSIQIVQGKRDEGDPNNRIIEIVFKNYEGADKRERMEALLSELWGWEDEIAQVKHNEAILEASQRAKKKLPELRKKFSEGLAPGEYFLFKAPFSTPDGNNEWMWVEAVNWERPDKITAILKNQPFNIPDLKAGSEVEIDVADVFDYIHRLPSGESLGNETGKLIEKYRNN